MRKQLAGIALLLFGILLAVAFADTNFALIGVALGFIGLILTIWYSGEAEQKDEKKEEEK
mgnify:CR=1 FL=1